MTTTQLLASIRSKLQDGIKSRHSDYHIMNVSYVLKGEVKTSCTVLRRITENAIWFNTDYRSQKITAIKESIFERDARHGWTLLQFQQDFGAPYILISRLEDAQMKLRERGNLWKRAMERKFYRIRSEGSDSLSRVQGFVRNKLGGKGWLSSMVPILITVAAVAAIGFMVVTNNPKKFR